MVISSLYAWKNVLEEERNGNRKKKIVEVLQEASDRRKKTGK